MLQAILDCADASFDHYDENRDVWMTIRDHCRGLLSDNDYGRYHELCDRDFDFFNYDDEENRLREWKEFLDKCDPCSEDIGSSDYDGQVNLREDIKNEAKVMRKRVIAHDQIKAFALFLEGKPALTAAYREFLVSVVSTVLACILLQISHHYSVGGLQLQGHREIGAWAAIGVYGAGGIQVGSGGVFQWRSCCGRCGRRQGGQRR